jgi:hypothetical protein
VVAVHEPVPTPPQRRLRPEVLRARHPRPDACLGGVTEARSRLRRGEVVPSVAHVRRPVGVRREVEVAQAQLAEGAGAPGSCAAWLGHLEVCQEAWVADLDKVGHCRLAASRPRSVSCVARPGGQPAAGEGERDAVRGAAEAGVAAAADAVRLPGQVHLEMDPTTACVVGGGEERLARAEREHRRRSGRVDLRLDGDEGRPEPAAPFVLDQLHRPEPVHEGQGRDHPASLGRDSPVPACGAVPCGRPEVVAPQRRPRT